MLIVGSFIPWLFYCFYCRPEPKIVYSASIVILGIGCIIVSLWDKFSEPLFRPVRAGKCCLGFFQSIQFQRGIFHFRHVLRPSHIRDHPIDPLSDHRRLLVRRQRGTIRMAGADGSIVHLRDLSVRNADSGTLLSWQMRHLGKDCVFALSYDFHIRRVLFQFSSHQLFHYFVVVAAFVHYHGITEMAVMRLQGASCEEKEYFNNLS